MSERIQTAAVARFTCLGDACEDTCCRGWDMQLTQETLDLYAREAPELLHDVERVDSGGAIMKRDALTDACVKFEQGWCSLQIRYGEALLGDACHFFPRISRSIGETVFVSATLSCPEAARLMLAEEGAFELAPREPMRQPYSLKQYLPAELSEGEAFGLHGLFVGEAGNAAFRAEDNMLRISAVVQSLAMLPMAQWPGAAAFHFPRAEHRIPAAEPTAVDPFNLAHALQGLVQAGRGADRPRLKQTLLSISEVLGITFTGNGISLANDSAARYLRMQHHWNHGVGEALQPVLRRYLQAQMSAALFPFAGLGAHVRERTTIIALRMAMVKLALMAEASQCNAVPPEPVVIRVVQSLSRFLDHLADPTLSMKIFEEAGWVREPRLRALLG